MFKLKRQEGLGSRLWGPEEKGSPDSGFLVRWYIGLDLGFLERAELFSGTEEGSGFSIPTLHSTERINRFKTWRRRKRTRRISQR